MKLRRSGDDERRQAVMAGEPGDSTAEGAADFLAAADLAISEILSGNSEEYLRETRQEGGE